MQTAASVSCNENISIVEEKLSTEEILKVVKIPEGYIVAAKPFKASCKGGESFKMGIMIPDNLEDVQALKCSGASCSSKTTSVATKLCPGKQVETYRSENVLNMSTVQARILPVQANLTGENNSLASGNFSVSFGGDVEASISMPSENQPEPVNKNVKIVGTPMVVRFNKESGADLVNVTMPYVLKSDEDESSVAVYAKRVDNNGSRWIYVGGRLDIIKKIVSAEVNLSLYAKDGEVTLAPITSFCPECTAGAEFVNPFTPDPDSRQAIILLHGLWGMGKVWEGLITSFRLTNQPYQLWTFSYLVNKPAQETARDLANYLEANQYRYDKIYIIGYSLGGLVSQSALRYAYEQNQINPQAYTFIGKVKKVLVVATPNAGSPVVKYLDTFISEYLNAESTSVVPINEQNKELLDKGIILEPVPNISYYAIAGTKSYDFMESLGLTRLLFGSELNDGLVGVTSVQRHGSGYLNESCVNYWSRPVVHTLIINDPLAQKIMGQIIASDMFKEMAAENIQTNLFGYSNYFELDIEQCSPGDLYVLVGKEKNISDIERAAYCACGNKVCDGLEDALTCPADCLVVEKPLMTRIIENSLTILALLIVLFMIGGFGYVLFEHYLKKKEPPELPPGFNLSKPISMERVKYLKVSITNLRNGLKTIRKRRALLRKSPPSATETVLLTEKEAALTKEEDMIESKIREYEEELEKESESVKDKTSASKKKGRGSRDKEQALNTKSISDIFDKGV